MPGCFVCGLGRADVSVHTIGFCAGEGHQLQELRSAEAAKGWTVGSGFEGTRRSKALREGTGRRMRYEVSIQTETPGLWTGFSVSPFLTAIHFKT